MEDQLFWLTSAPAKDGNKEATWKELAQATSSKGLSDNFKFTLPELRVGTLDRLMSLSDELAKSDVMAEAVAKKIARQLLDLLQKRPGSDEDSKGNGSSSTGPSTQVLTRASLEVNGMQVEKYLTNFVWDEAKYPTKDSMRDIMNTVMDQAGTIDDEMKIKFQEYNSTRQALQTVERKQLGSLMVRDLGAVVKDQDFVESENLATIFVVVPLYLEKEWTNSYENLTKFVVPRSSREIARDSEFILFSVTMFKRIVDDFRNAAREKRFHVRDFKFDEGHMKSAIDNQAKLEAKMKKSWAALVRWCQANFGEAFAAWIHLKALRVFTESVLRYGLPANFQASLLKPKKKQSSKLKDSLVQLYAHLGGGGGQVDKELNLSDPRALAEAYFPFVLLVVSLEVN